MRWVCIPSRGAFVGRAFCAALSHCLDRQDVFKDASFQIDLDSAPSCVLRSRFIALYWDNGAAVFGASIVISFLSLRRTFLPLFLSRSLLPPSLP